MPNVLTQCIASCSAIMNMYMTSVQPHRSECNKFNNTLILYHHQQLTRFLGAGSAGSRKTAKLVKTKLILLFCEIIPIIMLLCVNSMSIDDLKADNYHWRYYIKNQCRNPAMQLTCDCMCKIMIWSWPVAASNFGDDGRPASYACSCCRSNVLLSSRVEPDGFVSQGYSHYKIVITMDHSSFTSTRVYKYIRKLNGANPGP